MLSLCVFSKQFYGPNRLFYIGPTRHDFSTKLIETQPAGPTIKFIRPFLCVCFPRRRENHTGSQLGVFVFNKPERRLLTLQEWRKCHRAKNASRGRQTIPPNERFYSFALGMLLQRVRIIAPPPPHEMQLTSCVMCG